MSLEAPRFDVGPHLLGRVHEHDDQDYQLEDFLEAAEPKSVVWTDSAVFNQGRTGHCVGMGWAGWGDCLPVDDAYTVTDAHQIYYAAKVIDGQPGLENGSSVRSGAKVMQGRSRLNNYAFTHTAGGVVQALQQGPVVFGTDWTQGMFQPTPEGVVIPSGPVAGGHCYLCIGVSIEQGTFRFRNSWGGGWGLSGDFVMAGETVDLLLAQNGEACTAVELPISKPDPDPDDDEAADEAPAPKRSRKREAVAA